MSLQTLIIFSIAVLAALVLTVWMFAGGRYGGLRPSQESTEAYASFRVDSDKNYYSSGADFYPNALMGLDKSWRLESDLWKKREVTTEELKELVVNMNSRVTQRMAALQGFDIMDDRGWKIGDWYSIPGLNITVKVTGEYEIVITTPPIDTYPLNQ